MTCVGSYGTTLIRGSPGPGRGMRALCVGIAQPKSAAATNVSWTTAFTERPRAAALGSPSAAGTNPQIALCPMRNTPPLRGRGPKQSPAQWSLFPERALLRMAFDTTVRPIAPVATAASVAHFQHWRFLSLGSVWYSHERVARAGTPAPQWRRSQSVPLDLRLRSRST